MGCNCNSTKSFKGQKGLSAYEVWLDNGNAGTEAQFLASLIGVAGTNGIYLLENNVTPVTVTNGGFADMMTYTLLSANNLIYPFQNGDILEIEARFSATFSSSTKQVKILFDGTAITLPTSWATNAMSGAILKTTLTRVDATTILAEENVTYIDAFGGLTQPYSGYSSPITVSNMDTTDILINTQGFGTAITEKYLRITLKKHV